MANFLSRRINYPTIQFMGKRVIHRGRNKIRQKASTESLLKTQIRLLKSKVSSLHGFDKSYIIGVNIGSPKDYFNHELFSFIEPSV